jgi:hypothetical protein
MKIISSVLGEAETLRRSFEKIVDHALNNGSSRNITEEDINLAVFLDLFIQWYHDRQPEVESPPMTPFQNLSRPVFNDDTFTESAIHERTDFHDLDESDIMKSFEIDVSRSKLSDNSRQFVPSFRDGMKDSFRDGMKDSFRDGMKDSFRDSFKEPFDTFKPQQAKEKKNPIQELKQKCIEYTENSLVEQFIGIILSGFLEIPREKLEEIKHKAVSGLNAKMKILIEAAFDGDKRKWLETLGLPQADKEGLKYVEGIQKSIRELYRKGVNSSTNEDIDAICKSILQTPQLRSDMGKLLSSLTIQYSR